MTFLRSFFQSSSLETQLQRQLFVGLTIMLVAVSAVLHFTVQELTTRFVASRLQHDTDSLVAALSQSADGSWQIDENRLSSVYQRPYSGHYYRIQVGQINIRSRSLWDIRLPTEPSEKPSPGDHSQVSHLAGPNGQELLISASTVTKSQQLITIWIAEDVKPLQQLQMRFELGVLFLFGVSILVLLYLQKSIIKRNFSVFDDIHQSLMTLHQGEALRFPNDIPDEVIELVGEIERTLLRSTKQLHRSRTAVGNLAHELKRPLQNLRWQARHSSGAQADELYRLYDVLQNIVTRELRRAAISGSPSPGKRFNPAEDLPVLQVLLSRQHDHNVNLSMALPDSTLPFDRDDMLELIGNLLDNAWRFARTTVRLSIRSVPGEQWQIRIEDDGPGLPEEDYATLTQRGVTRDESSDDHQGLGLHIGMAVVESYEGHWIMSPSELGGLSVSILLPDQPSN